MSSHKIQRKGMEIPGWHRQDIKRVQKLPVPDFKEWVYHVGETLYYKGADDEREAIKERLHRIYGFGPARMERLFSEEEGRNEKKTDEDAAGMEKNAGKS